MLLASASEHKSSTLVSSALLSSQQTNCELQFIQLPYLLHQPRNHFTGSPQLTTSRETLIAPRPTLTPLRSTLTTLKPTLITTKPMLTTSRLMLTTLRPTLVMARPMLTTLGPLVATPRPMFNGPTLLTPDRWLLLKIEWTDSVVGVVSPALFQLSKYNELITIHDYRHSNYPLP